VDIQITLQTIVDYFSFWQSPRLALLFLKISCFVSLFPLFQMVQLRLILSYKCHKIYYKAKTKYDLQVREQALAAMHWGTERSNLNSEKLARD
jgi:hypothetical protein